MRGPLFWILLVIGLAMMVSMVEIGPAPAPAVKVQR